MSSVYADITPVVALLSFCFSLCCLPLGLSRYEQSPLLHLGPIGPFVGPLALGQSSWF